MFGIRTMTHRKDTTQGVGCGVVDRGIQAAERNDRPNGIREVSTV
jgi:hypothetical protein